ncbi:MAG: hypothetical protein QOE58_491 [Actinomycetota bacterium]|nr:hypothetical protein [Actinomycetota bacterium]
MDLFTARWSRSSGWSAPLPAWDGPGTLVLVFGDSDLLEDDTPLRPVVEAYPRSAMIGCSTVGAILGADIYDESVAVAVARFERTTLAVEVEPADRSDSAGVGLAIGKRLRDRCDDLRAVFVMADGFDVNGSALADGLTEGTNGTAAITGGLAGDGSHFERTWVLVDGHPRASYVSAVGLFGAAIEVSNGAEGGWTILGPQGVITRSDGNELLELDHRPALEVYEAYLGESVSDLPGTALMFPLGIRTGGPQDPLLIRTVLSVSEARQSMTFTDEVPEGATAQLMRGTTGRLVDAAQTAATQADAAVTAAGHPKGSEPGLAILVSGAGRRLYLGQRAEEELEAVMSELSPTYHLVGFYSYGELAPVSGGSCFLHNMTMTITVFRERPE